jgi:hypothetical protein
LQKDPDNDAEDDRPLANSFKDFEDKDKRDGFFHDKNRSSESLSSYLDISPMILFRNEKEIREIRGDSIEGSERQLHREWLAKRVVRDGFLWCGSRLNSNNESSDVCAIFDVDNETLVLTPRCTGLHDAEAKDKLRYERMSWMVSKQRGSLVASGMVRGMWDSSQKDATPYILSLKLESHHIQVEALESC